MADERTQEQQSPVVTIPAVPAHLREAVEIYLRDFTKKACDDCQDCGSVVMCDHHSALSTLDELWKFTQKYEARCFTQHRDLLLALAQLEARWREADTKTLDSTYGECAEDLHGTLEPYR